MWQEKKRQEEYEEFLKEKLMIDEIVRKIYEEDQRELQARLEKQKATRKFIEEFMQKREEVTFSTHNNNNDTQKAALAKLPLTTHPHEWEEPHTLQTRFCTHKSIYMYTCTCFDCLAPYVMSWLSGRALFNREQSVVGLNPT